MGELVGFGGIWAVVCWLSAILVVLAYCGWTILNRRAVTLLSFLFVLYVVVPILLQYPFTFSPLNILATGTAGYAAYVPVVDEALLVSIVGVASLIVGYVISPRLRILDRSAEFAFVGTRALAHPMILPAAVLGTIGLMLLIIVVGSVDLTLGVREYATRTPAIRPIFNLAFQLLPTMSGLTLLIAWNTRRRTAWVLAGLSVFAGILTGTRSAAFLGVVLFVVVECLFASYKRKMGVRQLLYLLPVGLLLLSAALVLGLSRTSAGSSLVSVASSVSTIFYGNTFSDLRDFAWILGFWDRAPLLGRTYAASILGFIPSALMPFRVQWGWGRWTTRTAGLSFGEVDAEHTGLRAGLFAEPYFNFGFIGVVLLSMAFGAVVRDLQRRGADSVANYDPLAAKLRLFAIMKVLVLSTAVISSQAIIEVYVMGAVVVVCRLVLFMLRQASANIAAVTVSG